MKVLKFVIAIILTVALLKVASTNSRGRPELVTGTDNGYTFEYTTVPKGLEFTEVRIPLIITGDFSGGQSPVFRYTTEGQNATTDFLLYAATPLLAADSLTDEYYTEITVGQKGKRFYYYVQIVDSTGAAIASFTEPDSKPFLFKYIGEVPKIAFLLHIIMIFASVFFISIASVNSVALVRGSTDTRPAARYFLVAAICAFLGCYPFGIPMNWYAFGVSWEGVPFGTDATDNKTQLLFVYLLFMVLAMWRSVTNGKMGRDIFTPKALGWFGIFAFVNMLAIYLIPHSIQFSAALTYSVCYTYIGLFALVYLIGLVNVRKTAAQSG